MSRSIRRARGLVGYWDGAEFVLESYLTGNQVVAPPQLCALLAEFDRPVSRHAAEARFGAVPGGKALLSSLLGGGILLELGTPAEEHDRRVDERWAWGHNARYFHYSTQEVDYTFDHSAVREHFERKARRDPPPSPYKRVQGRARRLTGGYAERSNGLWGALSRRRTVRAFDRRSISSDDLASLLLWTWGRTRSYNGSRLDRRILKTSPSGGARHPIEVYPVVQRVAGIAPGVYHYSVERHAMVLVRAGRREREMEDLFSGQAWAKDCAALFLMTAVLARSMWKYDFSRAYRVLHLDAGHLGQTLHLVATELGLGVFTTAALQDRRIESLLGLDGVDEVVLYAGGVGHARAR